jgi:hypothetical protein
MYGPRTGDLGVEGAAEFRGVGSTPDVWVRGKVSHLEDFRFHGLGNLSPDADAIAGEVVHLSQALLETRLRYRPVDGVVLGLGPIFEHLDPDPDQAALLRIPESARDAYGKVGLTAGLELDTEPGRTFGDGGFQLSVEGRLFPEVWDLEAPFGQLRAEAIGYAPLPGRTVLAARAGGAQLWGEAPLLEHVALGGSRTLRGFQFQRFTGDAMAYGGVELRTVLTRARLIVRGDLGMLAFTDVGRVFVDGRSEGNWQTGYGVGVWFESLGSTVSATYAQGEDHRLYLKLGLPY